MDDINIVTRPSDINTSHSCERWVKKRRITIDADAVGRFKKKRGWVALRKPPRSDKCIFRRNRREKNVHDGVGEKNKRKNGKNSFKHNGKKM